MSNKLILEKYNELLQNEYKQLTEADMSMNSIKASKKHYQEAVHHDHMEDMVDNEHDKKYHNEMAALHRDTALSHKNGDSSFKEVSDNHNKQLADINKKYGKK